MENSIPDTVTCILCHGAVTYRDGDKMRFREHMRSEHGAFFELDFLLASCLMDVQAKDSWASTVRSLDCGEREETLRENTNYEKDDLTSFSVSNEEKVEISQAMPEPSLKKKRGRKKKANVPADDISSTNPEVSLDKPIEETENDDSFYSDVESLDMSSSSYHEENVENLLSEAKEENIGEEERERFICQVESCGKSYNSKGNKMTHEKKAHGILGPRAAKKQRMSVSTEETQLEDIAMTDSAEVLNETPSSGSFLTDTSLGFENVPDENDDGEDAAMANPAEVSKTGGEIDLSSSNYFKKNPKILNTARGKSIQLFDQVNPLLPSGWKQRTLTVASKSGEKVTNKHYLSQENKVLKSGMAVVEYLRLKGDHNIDELKLLAKNLNIADKKFQSLFSE